MKIKDVLFVTGFMLSVVGVGWLIVLGVYLNWTSEYHIGPIQMLRRAPWQYAAAISSTVLGSLGVVFGK